MQETAPLNLDGLQSLCSALTAAALQEVDDPLSVTEYLKVVFPCCVTSKNSFLAQACSDILLTGVQSAT